MGEQWEFLGESFPGTVQVFYGKSMPGVRGEQQGRHCGWSTGDQGQDLRRKVGEVK